MKKLSLTKSQIAFIRKNRLNMSGSEMALRFGVSKSVVHRFMRKNGLTAPKELVIKWRTDQNRRPFTPAEDRYIIKQLQISSIKKIAKELHRTSQYISRRAKELGLQDIITQNALNSRLKSGHVPGNKGMKQSEYMSVEAIERTKATRFKKGHKPHNTKDRDGVISIRLNHKKQGSKPYKYIRISEGKWYPYHQYRWEKFRRKIQKGMCLWFKDGDTLNTRLSNLELISRAENLRRNRTEFLQMPDDVRRASTLLKRLNKKINGKEQAK